MPANVIASLRRIWLLVVVAMASGLTLGLGGCDLFPKTGTEWAIAGVIFGVLLIGVVYLSIKNSKGPPKT